jgi:replicative superfamily II helicase
LLQEKYPFSLNKISKMRSGAPVSTFVLPRTIEGEDEEALQEMLQSKAATFRSIHQYQVYRALKVPGHIILSVAATGSGKTLPYQLLMHTEPTPACSVMIVPYNVLIGEMMRRHEAVGLTVAQYDRRLPFPSDKKVVVASLEVLSQGTQLYDSLAQFAATGRLKCIVVDEART